MKRILVVVGAGLIIIALIWHEWSLTSMESSMVTLPATSSAAQANTDDVLAIAQQMSDKQVRRMPVLDADDKLIGIVSL